MRLVSHITLICSTILRAYYIPTFPLLLTLSISYYYSIFFLYVLSLPFFFFFFFNDTATTEIYTLSLHDALPIWIPDEINDSLAYDVGRAYAAFVKPKKVAVGHDIRLSSPRLAAEVKRGLIDSRIDRKSTRLNSSHDQISYAVFCLKKKKTNNKRNQSTINTLYPTDLPTASRTTQTPTRSHTSEQLTDRTSIHTAPASTQSVATTTL